MARDDQPLSRSEQMARIGSRNTSPELRLRKALWKEGLRYRLHMRTPAGRPDLVFPGKKICVYIDGCFWHGCPDHYVLPRSRQPFWLEKLRTNVQRDRQQTAELEALGWTVIRVWEHEAAEQLEASVERIRRAILDGEPEMPVRWRVDKVEVVNPSTDLERRHLVSLRDPVRSRVEERTRSTKKWRRPDG